MAIRYSSSLDRTFHALGDATRRGMLATLVKKGECTAGELGEPFRISQPTASKHLRVLENAGLLSRRVDGRVHRFRLCDDPLKEAAEWIGRHQAFWEQTLGRLGEFLEDIGNEQGSDHG